VFEVEGIIHYCVANMPGAYPRTSTLALTNATLPYVKLLANKGIEKALGENAEIRSSLNTYQGKIMNEALKKTMGFDSPECTGERCRKGGCGWGDAGGITGVYNGVR
jgi:alanine dehydrogenase